MTADNGGTATIKERHRPRCCLVNLTDEGQQKEKVEL
jgi:hypothetical protein